MAKEVVTVFTTPGELDLKAITHMGINSKPNTNNPIGFFGTGLKYAVATLARKGIKMEIHHKGKVVRFTTQTEEFRDKSFGFIYMTFPKQLFKPAQALSYTTELGKTWELWQVFRELYSNTLDEGGYAEVSDMFEKPNSKDSLTYIVVFGEEFAQEYYKRDKTFLPGASQQEEVYAEDAVEMFDQSSDHIYYRGMRVMDLDLPSKFTYNILAKIELTEDRTAKYPDTVERLIREHIINETDTGKIAAILRAPKGTYEQRLNFNGYHFRPVGVSFYSTAKTIRSENTTVSDLLSEHKARLDAEEEVFEAPFVKYLIAALYDRNSDRIGDICRDFHSELYSELIAKFPEHEVKEY